MVTDTMIAERLARIETNQQNQDVQLAKVLDLLDRMVRVEERQQNGMHKAEEISIRLKQAEKELDSWRTARRIIGWTSGIVGAVVTGWILFLVTTRGSA